MANNGYISSSGIDQVFTTGPYVGAIVTSSYSSGSTLLGPTITFYQSFISGSTSIQGGDTLSPCSDIFYRYRYDPINCPVGDCLPPTIISTAVANCNQPSNYNYFLFFNSGSTNALYSTIEYSTSPNFSFNTGSYAVTNSLNNYTSSINIGNLELLPFKTTPVYFRIFNSCSLGGTSSYSPIVSASCLVPPPPSIQPFTVRLKNSMVGGDNTLYYKNGGIEFALFGGSSVNIVISTLSNLGISFRTLAPEGSVRTIIVSGSSPIIDGFVTTELQDDTPDYFGDIIYQSINIYPANLYYNSLGTPDAAVRIDRTLWPNAGLIEIDFTSFVPSNESNPWYYVNLDPDPDPGDGLGGSGGGSN
jgi:hypothetical protein